MKISEIISICREQFLDDTKPPYRWNDVYLAQALTQAEIEAAKRASLLHDEVTQTADNVAGGTATSTTANKLVDTNASFTTAYVNQTVYNTIDNTWATITARDSATVLSLSRDIMASGETYVIGDASEALCRVCVSQDVSTYSLSSKVFRIDDCYLASDSKSLIHKTKGWLDRFYYQWRTATGTPRYYFREGRQITLVPKPSETDTLNLSIFRLPLQDLSIITDNEPEIPEDYHFDLIHWVCFLAYSKEGNDTLDTEKAKLHFSQFVNKFGVGLSANAETILKKVPGDFCLEHPGFGL